MGKRTLRVLLTGGTRGLGRKISEYLVGQGHEVYVLDKTDKNEIDPLYLSILSGYTECDLSNTDQLVTCFVKLIDQIEWVDVLINNASVRQFTKKLDEFRTSEIQQNINVDFIAPVILSNLCLPIMKKNSFGRIINISSIGAYKVFIKGSLYCSSKRALIAFNESLSRELENLKGAVTVNTICPDSFSTVDGAPKKNYCQQIDSILASIDRFIQSGSNGVVINSFTLKHKLRESLRFIKLAIQMQIN